MGGLCNVKQIFSLDPLLRPIVSKLVMLLTCLFPRLTLPFTAHFSHRFSSIAHTAVAVESRVLRCEIHNVPDGLSGKGIPATPRARTNKGSFDRTSPGSTARRAPNPAMTEGGLASFSEGHGCGLFHCGHRKRKNRSHARRSTHL